MGGLLIENGILIDGTGAPPKPGGWVLVQEDTIAAIGAGAPPAPELLAGGIHRVDAMGGSILPGLINLHVHIHRRHLHRPASQLAFRAGAASVESLPDPLRILWSLRNLWWEMQEGVTTFRDISSKNRLNLTIKRAIQMGIFKGPRLVCCGQGIGMTGGHGTHGSGTVEADGPDEVRKAVRAELKAGADFIKVMASAGLAAMPDEDPRMVEYSVEELRAACEEAHARFRRVAAHVYPARAIQNCLAAGVDCIEHGSIMDDETIAMMAEKGASYVPTMTGMYNFWQKEVNYGRKDVAHTVQAVILEPHRIAVLKCYEKGVRIGVGTDTLGQVNQEIELLHDCGIPAMACLRSATSVGAEIAGLEREIGTLEVGKKADILVAGGNAAEDLTALRDVRAVIHDGWVVDGDALASFRQQA